MKVKSLRERVIKGLEEFTQSNVLTRVDPLGISLEVSEDLKLLYLLVADFVKIEGNTHYLSMEPFDIKAQFPFTHTTLKYRWLLLLQALYPKIDTETWKSWYSRIADKYTAVGYTAISNTLSMEVPTWFDDITPLQYTSLELDSIAVSAYQESKQYNTLKIEQVVNPYKSILENEELVNPEKLVAWLTPTATKGLKTTSDAVELAREINEGLNPDFPYYQVVPSYTIYTSQPKQYAKDL